VLFSHYCCAPSSSDPGTGNADAENADISSLLEMLGTVRDPRDPRDPRGKQHALAFVLAVCVVATLAGAKNYAEIARRARDMP
jgi:DDE_Tnp_1-associated